MGSEVINEIYLFVQIAGIQPENSFYHQLISRLIPSEAKLYTAFLHMSTDKKIIHNCINHSISLSQPRYIRSILEDFHMLDCNPPLTLMEEGAKLSVTMLPRTPEEKLGMQAVPYQELVGKLLYLAISTCPDMSFAIGILYCFVENPGQDH